MQTLGIAEVIVQTQNLNLNPLCLPYLMKTNSRNVPDTVDYSLSPKFRVQYYFWRRPKLRIQFLFYGHNQRLKFLDGKQVLFLRSFLTLLCILYVKLDFAPHFICRIRLNPLCFQIVKNLPPACGGISMNYIRTRG